MNTILLLIKKTPQRTLITLSQIWLGNDCFLQFLYTCNNMHYFTSKKSQYKFQYSLNISIYPSHIVWILKNRRWNYEFFSNIDTVVVRIVRFLRWMVHAFNEWNVLKIFFAFTISISPLLTLSSHCKELSVIR